MARKLAEVTNSEATADDLTAQVATLRADVTALTELLGDYTKSKGAELSETAKEKFTSVRDESKARAAAAAEAAGQHATQLHGQANDFVKNQPATAMGVAAGIGFLIGFMSGRK